jgi:hypothetical protein
VLYEALTAPWVSAALLLLVLMLVLMLTRCCCRHDTYQDEVRLLAGGAVAHATHKQLMGPRD